MKIRFCKQKKASGLFWVFVSFGRKDRGVYLTCTSLALNSEMSLPSLVFEPYVTHPPKDHDGVAFHLSTSKDT